VTHSLGRRAKKGDVLFPCGIEGGEKLIQKYVKESIEYVLTLPNPKGRA